MSNDHRTLSLTPCAGRCSTVFGDQVCRGCRRFNHEVIQWNTYTVEQRLAVWKRLDDQLDQILVPMLPQANIQHVEGFILSKRVRLMEGASKGRKLYHALKICEKISILHLKVVWVFQKHKLKTYGLNLKDVSWLWLKQVMSWLG